MRYIDPIFKTVQTKPIIRMSQITTHILDTSLGKPAEGVNIKLQQMHHDGWKTIAEGNTNSDGRIADLLTKETILPSGAYRMFFDTKSYFTTQNLPVFYPEVGIVFTVFDDSHYHIPLLLNPFGYSTYRGS